MLLAVLISPPAAPGGCIGSHLLVLVFQVSTSPLIGEVGYSTSAKAEAFASAILASALALVKYKREPPSLTTSVLPVKVITPAPES